MLLTLELHWDEMRRVGGGGGGGLCFVTRLTEFHGRNRTSLLLYRSKVLTRDRCVAGTRQKTLSRRAAWTNTGWSISLLPFSCWIFCSFFFFQDFFWPHVTKFRHETRIRIAPNALSKITGALSSRSYRISLVTKSTKFKHRVYIHNI